MVYNVLTWLEETAARLPDKLAYVDGDVSYTYAQVRRMAVSVAANIRAVLPGKKHPVAVFMPKSADMLIAYLGIASSGNFYSPIATDMPVGRVEKIMETLRPDLVLTTAALRREVGTGGETIRVAFDGPVLEFEKVSGNPAAAAPNLAEIVDSDLLYVLFTSGSTGVPKGVGITHRSVIDYIDWVTEEFGITAADSFGNQAPFYFDNSILDIYSCLKTGATLHLIPAAYFSQPVKLLGYLAENKITTIFWVPSALIMVSKLKAFRNVDVSATLKRVLFCGEVMPNKQLNIWRKYLPGAVYANLYGPTEITDACTFYVADREFADDEPLPIGRPMRNTEILVLDEHDRLVTGPDAVGELCVRGTSLSVGYYNNPEKTAAAFVQNPLQTAYEEKIYRTGDLVKYNERGELIYLSRKDFQIKHLGHRIELGEIETAVSSLDGISLCCCLYDQEHSRIVLFLEGSFTRSEINARLKSAVPDYMLPGKVISLEKLPLNLNGKIDRVKLRQDYLK